MTDKPSIFISYSWVQKEYADKIEHELDGFVNIVRDKNSATSWCNLIDFMKRIRDEDFAILLVSDEYLKSLNCMYEITQLVKEQNWEEKIFTTVFDNASAIYDSIGSALYIKYWDMKRDELERALSSLPLQSQTKHQGDYQKVCEILNIIGEFLKVVNEKKNPPPPNFIAEIKNYLGLQKIEDTLTHKLRCPSCSKGYVLYNKPVDEIVSLQCPKCNRFFRGNLLYGRTWMMKAPKKKPDDSDEISET